MGIDWDPARAKSNWIKHGVQFCDVEVVFNDIHAISIEDPDSKDAPQFIALGMDSLNRPVVAVYAYRDTGIRLISARKASRAERRVYEKGIRL
jgi:uncharacterized DUF497 family protein